jgi:hypothetical protein
MLVCETCGWKDDGASAGFAACPCCGSLLTGAAAAPSLVTEQAALRVGADRLTERAAASAPQAGVALRMLKPYVLRAARHWWWMHAVVPLAAVAAGGLALAGVASFLLPEREPRTAPAAAESRYVVTEPSAAVPAPVAPAPPADAVGRELARYLPAGYSVAATPALVRSDGGGAYAYRVILRAADGGAVYRVPLAALRLPPDAPELLRELAGRLRVEPGLPPGMEYDLDARQLVVPTGGTVQAEWRAAWTPTAGGWRLAYADSVRVDPSAAEDGGRLLNAAGIDAARARRDAALAELAERCHELDRVVEAYRAEVMANVPEGCPAAVAPLLREVVRLSTECPRMTETGTREECYARRETLNRKIGDCEERDQERERALAAAEHQANEFRRRRVASLAAELDR